MAIFNSALSRGLGAVVVLAAVAGSTFHFKEDILRTAQSLHLTSQPKSRSVANQAPAQPSLNLSLAPTATPTLKTTPKPTTQPVTSIAELKPSSSPAPQSAPASAASLPRSGPDIDLGSLVVAGSGSGGVAYYLSLRRRIRRQWRKLEIL